MEQKEREARGLAREIVGILIRNRITLATIESCTGGMVGELLTTVPGVSQVYRGGYITYDNDMKHFLVGVQDHTLEHYGAVSSQAAWEMANGCAERLCVRAALSVTGNAGPDPSEGKPVGLVYLGCTLDGETRVRECRFSGDREEIRQSARRTVLTMLLERLLEKGYGEPEKKSEEPKQAEGLPQAPAEHSGTCVLVCAGDFPEEKLEVGEDDLLIAVDAGLDNVRRLGLTPDLVVGDFDSLPQERQGEVQALEGEDRQGVVYLPIEKDDTDSVAAAKAGLARGYRRFVIYGGLGGERMDHSLANLQTLQYLMENGAVQAQMRRGGTTAVLLQGPCRLSTPEGFAGIFSLFALSERCTGVTISGMKYPLQDGVITSSFPLGVSNAVYAGSTGTVEIAEGTALAVLVEGAH